MIHATAIIDKSANLGRNVSVGAYSIIGPEVTIGDNTVVGPHAVIKGPTVIGENNQIFQFTSIGEDCQDKKYRGEPTRSEEHTSELQSRGQLVCRHLLEKKKATKQPTTHNKSTRNRQT